MSVVIESQASDAVLQYGRQGWLPTQDDVFYSHTLAEF